MKRKKFEKNRIVPACAFLAAAVSYEMVSPDRTAEVDREKIRVEVSIPQGATKMTSPGSEGLVNDFQVFVFREDGTLDAYTSGTGNTATVDCTSGPKDFVAVVNAPDLADVASRQELMSSRSMMADKIFGESKLDIYLHGTIIPPKGAHILSKTGAICRTDTKTASLPGGLLKRLFCKHSATKLHS